MLKSGAKPDAMMRAHRATAPIPLSLESGQTIAANVSTLPDCTPTTYASVTDAGSLPAGDDSSPAFALR
jgi:hypothetical protein